MKQFFTLIMLCVSVGLIAQVNYTANNNVTPYDGIFRPGVNPSFYPEWSSEQVADVAAGNPYLGIPGVGVKTLRTAMSDDFTTQFGYDYLLPAYEHYDELGLTDLTTIVGFPHPSHQENMEYCSGIQSEMFEGLYEPIWDGGANGTPYNDANFFAAYMYEVTTRYTQYIKFWEIWNEPGFDYTFNCGWREPGDPVCNWWDQDPDPCDNKLRAPIQRYVRTLRIAYDVIKTVSPDDYVVVAGVGFESFLDAILRNTDNPVDGSVTADYPLGGGAYFDVMGFHSYPHFDGTTIFYNPNIGGLDYERHSDRAAYGIPFKQSVRQPVLDNYGYDGITYPKKDWIITEINIPRDPVGGNWIGSEEAQKNYIIKAMVNAMKYNVLQIHTFRLAEREYFGTANNGQTGNPELNLMGFYQRMDDIMPYEQIINIEGIAHKTASDCLFGSSFDEALTNQLNLPSDVDGGAFRFPNGDIVYVIWAKTTVDLSEVASANYSFPASFGFSNVYKKEWDFSQTVTSSMIGSNNIALTATPIFITENEFIPPPIITLNCSDDVTVVADININSNGAVVNYDLPEVTTTCSTGLAMNLVGGLSSGATFPIGVTEVTYEATDDCGNVVICSFDVTVQLPIGGCPQGINGFTYLGEYNGHKYFISDEVARPTDAQVTAGIVGGHLAVMNDQGENEFLRQNIPDLVYIGLNDANTEGSMQWVNDEPVNYTNYDPCSFCAANTDDNDYVVMHSWNGGWSFSNQFNKRLFVIELPCDGSSPSNLSLNCPPNQSVTFPANAVGTVVNWNDPTAQGDCPAGIGNIQKTGGPISGSILGVGNYTVSYSVSDNCGNVVTCSFTIEVSIDGGGGGTCPDDFTGFTTLGEYNGHKYYISNDPATPVNAQMNAEQNDGYLVVINDQAENDFIQQNINDLAYIGLNDYDSEGDLVWVNGEPVNYTNINPCGFCEPNSDEMDFAIMQPWNGGWSFANFWNERLYIMEVNCDGPQGSDIVINCPAPLEVQVEIITGTALVEFPNAIASTSCPTGGLSITQTDGISSGTVQGPGEYEIEFTATDDCGNTKTCYTKVVVIGNVTCPDNLPGHTYLGEWGGSAYFISNAVSQPENAEAIAQGVGGHLATIDTQAENDFLQPLIDGLVYIGLNDASTEGTLEWFGGNPVNYTNFDICGFCNPNGDDMDYVVMHSWNGGWSWSNFYNERNYIVEVPCTANLNSSNAQSLAAFNNASANAITNDEVKKPTLESVIPNPADNYVFVKINSQMEENVDVQIFDARGVLVKTERIGLYKGLVFKELDISELPDGMFFIKILQGQEQHSHLRFVKARN